GQVSESQIREMLGLADRARIFDLFEAVMRGDIAAGLAQMAEQYAAGADPVVILQDLLEVTHWLTRLKLAPDAANGPLVPETERIRGGSMASAMSMANLVRAWQILLKGLAETRSAPSPLQAAEMVLIRLAYAADLPSPADVIESLRGSTDSPSPPPDGPKGNAGGPLSANGFTPVLAAVHGTGGKAQAGAALRIEPQAQEVAPGALPSDFTALVGLVADHREPLLAACLDGAVHLVHYEPGRIDFRPAASAPPDLATRLSRLLGEWTGRPWLVSLSRETGQPTLREQRLELEIKRKADAASHPLVQAILAAFPGASIEAVRDLTETAALAADLADPEPASGEDE
ncbi:MAG TPA: DNA polymerase III subunit gamma/tau, partial [Rhodospirillaceae bacterium]|nr:DNA polymerase III subunit gamma/tau [Rhodospirillaceae bacterium]